MEAEAAAVAARMREVARVVVMGAVMEAMLAVGAEAQERRLQWGGQRWVAVMVAVDTECDVPAMTAAWAIKTAFCLHRARSLLAVRFAPLLVIARQRVSNRRRSLLAAR